MHVVQELPRKREGGRCRRRRPLRSHPQLSLFIAAIKRVALRRQADRPDPKLRPEREASVLAVFFPFFSWRCSRDCRRNWRERERERERKRETPLGKGGKRIMDLAVSHLILASSLMQQARRVWWLPTICLSAAGSFAASSQLLPLPRG